MRDLRIFLIDPGWLAKIDYFIIDTSIKHPPGTVHDSGFFLAYGILVGCLLSV